MIGIEARNLRCELTKQEIDERASTLARTIRERDEAEATKKEVATDFKQRIETMQLKMSALAREVSEGATYRMVDCRLIRNEHAQQMELVRTDTGEIVESRPMTREEKQRSLFDEGDDARPGASQ